MSQLELNADTSDAFILTFFADVILPLPLPKKYTYRIPAALSAQIETGSRVIVQLGKSRIHTAVVATIHQNAPKDYEAKYILDVLDESPVVNKFQLQLFEWMAEYYMCTLGEVMNAALPSGLKLSSESMLQLKADYNEKQTEFEFSSPEQDLIEALKRNQSLSYKQASDIAGKKNVHKIIKSLISKGRILLFEEVKEKFTPKIIRKIRIKSEYIKPKSLEALFSQLEKKPKQVEVILKYLQVVALLNNPELNEKGIEKNNFANSIPSPAALNTLIKNNIFEEFTVVISRFKEFNQESTEIILSPGQEKAKTEILEKLESKETVLLHGITGSGKTEVFIDLIKKAIAGGSTVLYMLPEIALTTQMVGRLKKIFGDKMGVYHSKFSDNERVEVWQGVLSGKFPLVVGVRSSIFLPFDNLGLIIIDEEHESSYKQYDPAPRYHARDAALMLSKLHHSKTVLGSATPSFESYHHAKTGKWGLVKLDKRFGDAQLPEIFLANTRIDKRNKTMKNDFSSLMLSTLEECVKNKEQAILFQNRRGYAPYLSCEVCTHIFKCENCAVSLTYHMYKEELSCHYCGYMEKLPRKCIACESTQLKTVGLGTEKIEEELKLFLPEVRVLRMDLDTTRKKNSYQKIIEDFENHQIDILVGTQMVSKGFDFGNVSTVGIFDADRMIHFPDFRSHEKAFQMLAQVSGRAGRRDKRGKVVIQTSNPEQKIFNFLESNNYEALYDQEIEERRKFHYPPFVRLIKITVKDKEEKVAQKAAGILAENLSKELGAERVLGPEAPLINRIRNYFLVDVFIKLEREKINLNAAKKIIQNRSEELLFLKDFKKTLVLADVDPV